MCKSVLHCIYKLGLHIQCPWSFRFLIPKKLLILIIRWISLQMVLSIILYQGHYSRKGRGMQWPWCFNNLHSSCPGAVRRMRSRICPHCLCQMLQVWIDTSPGSTKAFLLTEIVYCGNGRIFLYFNNWCIWRSWRKAKILPTDQCNLWPTLVDSERKANISFWQI